ncbi:plasmid mobilization protein [Chitinophaga barathri]|uniref:Plasmid mobilization relaxosome protein MobC n=1 Tax=Chitinophaga barathri TaxID=1647451 RepID=A0A3N4MAW1_9BACT|nr:plasmid mobilization relaxosome protein MobC [Chitinophaga barathri]RPD40618.1 plasmid mobilization relaxosome protein MobC [Chitinophaga barathri]
MQQENKKEPKKRVLIQLRTNEADKNTLITYAKESGMTITDFVKSRTLGKAPRTKMATPERLRFLQFFTEVNRIGVNVNQIAKAFHTGHFGELTEDVILKTLEDLRAVSAQILNHLDDSAGQTARERQSVGDLSAEQSGQ